MISTIFDDARAGSVESVRHHLVVTGTSVDNKDDKGRTALHYAAAFGHSELSSFLLQVGAFPSAKDDYGDTPLHPACLNGHLAVVKLLVQGGADPTISNSAGKTPLIMTSNFNQTGVAQYLLGVRAVRDGIDARDIDGKTALWWVSYFGRPDLLKILADAGANPTVASDNGTTPLMHRHPRNGRTRQVLMVSHCK